MSNSMIMAAALVAVIAGWVMREIAWQRRLGIWRIDQVTGLPVRQAFYRDARVVLGQPGVVLILVDLDDFKAVNDTYGHLAGDRVLSAIGARLREFFGSHAALGRLGGDEFAGLTQLGPASGSWRETLTRLPAHLAEPIPLPDGATVTVRASIGAVHLNQTRRPNLSAALQLADSLLYQAKRANGMRFHVVEPGDPTVTRPVDQQPYHRHRHGAGAGHDTDGRPASTEVSTRTPLPS